MPSMAHKLECRKDLMQKTPNANCARPGEYGGGSPNGVKVSQEPKSPRGVKVDAHNAPSVGGTGFPGARDRRTDEKAWEGTGGATAKSSQKAKSSMGVRSPISGGTGRIPSGNGQYPGAGKPDARTKDPYSGKGGRSPHTRTTPKSTKGVK